MPWALEDLFAQRRDDATKKILFAQRRRERREVSRRASGALNRDLPEMSAVHAALGLTASATPLRSLRLCANHLLPASLRRVVASLREQNQ